MSGWRWVSWLARGMEICLRGEYSTVYAHGLALLKVLKEASPARALGFAQLEKRMNNDPLRGNRVMGGMPAFRVRVPGWFAIDACASADAVLSCFPIEVARQAGDAVLSGAGGMATTSMALMGVSVSTGRRSCRAVERARRRSLHLGLESTGGLGKWSPRRTTWVDAAGREAAGRNAMGLVKTMSLSYAERRSLWVRVCRLLAYPGGRDQRRLVSILAGARSCPG
jgi:hypothetical protein